jgi:CubicO group peptidase (beta-lactamase class C family)
MFPVAYWLGTVCYVGVLWLIVGRLSHLSYLTIGILALISSAYLISANSASAQSSDKSLGSVLEPIRAKFNVPALAGAIFTTEGLVEMGAVGVRKAGTTVAVTADDQWHLGSDTKMMTALLAGTFVVEKKLAWDDKVISFFPDLAAQVPEAMRAITVGQVLNHLAGLKENLDWWPISRQGDLSAQRLVAVRDALTHPAYAPGAFHYANTDYVVIGAILEKLGGKPWEELIRERIFQPLDMKAVGFGGLGTVGQIDQPWPHLQTGTPSPTNGPLADNPEVMGPAGTVHCSVSDWTKFLTDQLRGATGMKTLLPNEIYQAMQTPGPKSEYGYGWLIVDRSWAGGKALNHAGSNTMNFCVCWLAPAKKFGVLVCTNQGGDTAFKACDAVASALIQRHLK